MKKLELFGAPLVEYVPFLLKLGAAIGVIVAVIIAKNMF